MFSRLSKAVLKMPGKHLHLGTKDNPVEFYNASLFREYMKYLLSISFSGIVIYVFYFQRSNSLTKPKSSQFMDMVENYKVAPETKTASFDDVRGITEVQDELLDIVDMLKNREKYHKLGAKLPHGLLLTGEPGTGKTLLARAIAGEAGVTFFSSSGSDFEEVFVGIGASRIRHLFSQAKALSPSIIFIDEIDTLGSARKSRNSIETQRATLNQLLVEMDGFEDHDNILVIGATNAVEDMDHALLRPGRFDKEIQVPVPHLADREEIIKLYLDKVAYDPKIDINRVARSITGFTGADIANLINTAILIAIKDGRSACTEADIEKAKDRISMGISSPNVFRTESQKMKIALREISKALIVLWTPGAFQLYKTSILKRANREGKTSVMPVKDLVSITKAEALASLDIKLAGKACEEIFFPKEQKSESPRMDILDASSSLYKFIMQGMFEDEFGLLFFKRHSDLGPEQKDKLDECANKILQASYNRVKEQLSKNKPLITHLAKILVSKETLTREELLKLIDEFKKKWR